MGRLSSQPKPQCPLLCYPGRKPKCTNTLSLYFLNSVHIRLSPVPSLSQSHSQLHLPRNLVPIPNPAQVLVSEHFQ